MPKPVRKHTGHVQHGLATDSVPNLDDRWRWVCTCGMKGRWNGHGEAATEIQWTKHFDRVHA